MVAASHNIRKRMPAHTEPTPSEVAHISYKTFHSAGKPLASRETSPRNVIEQTLVRNPHERRDCSPREVLQMTQICANRTPYCSSLCSTSLLITQFSSYTADFSRQAGQDHVDTLAHKRLPMPPLTRLHIIGNTQCMVKRIYIT